MQFQCMDVVGKLFGGFVYDFNNLLVIFMGNLFMLDWLEGLIDKSVLDGKVVVMLEVVCCGLDLIEWLLVFSCGKMIDLCIVVLVLIIVFIVWLIEGFLFLIILFKIVCVDQLVGVQIDLI